MKEINKKKIAVIIVLCIMLVLSIVVIIRKAPSAILNGVEYMEDIDEEYKTVNVEDYGNWSGHIESEKQEVEGKSGLRIFPKKSKDLEVEEYIYNCEKTNASVYKYLIYSKIKYSEIQFKVERERLSKLKCDIAIDGKKSIVKKKIKFSDKLFQYPAYVAIYASNYCYEYALLNEESNEIIYVFTKMADANGIIEERYLPKEVVGKDMYENDSWDNQNMYWAEDSDGNHVSYDF